MNPTSITDNPIGETTREFYDMNLALAESEAMLQSGKDAYKAMFSVFLDHYGTETCCSPPEACDDPPEACDELPKAEIVISRFERVTGYAIHMINWLQTLVSGPVPDTTEEDAKKESDAVMYRLRDACRICAQEVSDLQEGLSRYGEAMHGLPSDAEPGTPAVGGDLIELSLYEEIVGTARMVRDFFDDSHWLSRMREEAAAIFQKEPA